MNKKITIAIDGFSSTGKSTLAKQLANHLGYIYVDTGAMYRAVTFYAMEKGYIDDNHFDKELLIKDLPGITLHFSYNPDRGFAEIYLNNTNLENNIRTLAVSGKVSHVAKIAEVRAKLVEQQQKMGADKGVVMDGRDIGTVVFPDAELKLYMTASAEKRAQRRYTELQDRGEAITYDQVLKNVQERDRIDSGRENSPLVQADDAIAMDNSDMTIEEQFEKVLQLVNSVR